MAKATRQQAEKSANDPQSKLFDTVNNTPGHVPGTIRQPAQLLPEALDAADHCPALDELHARERASQAARRCGAPVSGITGAQSSQTTPPRLTAGGVDWLESSIYGRWWSLSRFGDMRDKLDAAKLSAQADGKPAAVKLGDGVEVFVMPSGCKHGKMPYPWILKVDGIELHIRDHAELHDTIPSVIFTASSMPLMAYGPRECWARCKYVLDLLGFTMARDVIGRLDVCADLVGVDVFQFVEHYAGSKFVARAAYMRTYVDDIGGSMSGVGRRWTGFDHGTKSGSLKVRVYDKLWEVRSDPAKRQLMIDRRWGHIPREATRVEFQLRRDALKRIYSLGSVDEALDMLPIICERLTNDWFRITEDVPDRRHKNQSRAKTADIWSQVQKSFSAWAGVAKQGWNAFKRAAKVNPVARVKCAVGNLYSALAQLGRLPAISDNVDETIDCLAHLMREALTGALPELQLAGYKGLNPLGVHAKRRELEAARPVGLAGEVTYLEASTV